MQRIDELAALRAKVDSALTVALWLHVPLIAGVAWWLGNATFVLGGGAAVVAAAVTVIHLSWPPDTMRRIAMGVGIVVMVSLLLAAAMGGAWQTDIHMYYFAMLAVLAAYSDRNVILAAAGVTAVHHLTLSFIAPALLFSGRGDIGRVLLHAAILIIEAGTLVWLADYLARLITANATALSEADAARATVQAKVEQEAMQRQAAEIRRDAMVSLSGRFEASVGSLVESLNAAAAELQSSSQVMATTADETMRQANTVASASEQATRNVQTVASATEELTASISAIGQQVTQVSLLIKASVRQATMTNTQVKSLTEAADKIGDVVRIISDIAGQTNLLALNATIEAARAGDAGKGFAVVAAEVKALANQTAKATDEVGAQIKAIQSATQIYAELIQGITATIEQVSATAANIASAVEEQGTATREIAQNVVRAAQGTEEVSGSIGSVGQAAEHTGGVAKQVFGAATALAKNGEALMGQVATFLREVHAA